MVIKSKMARAYNMAARAEAVEARRQGILEAAYELFVTVPHDELTLEAVAERAGVSIKTVVRQFQTKDELLVACLRSGSQIEEGRREVAPGDVPGVVAVLARRYDELVDIVPRMIALQDRIETIAAAMAGAIESHKGWLAHVFAPWLPPAGPVRKRRIMALYGATEIHVWWMWRRRLGLGPKAAAAAMRETLDALVARWTVEESEAAT